MMQTSSLTVCEQGKPQALQYRNLRIFAERIVVALLLVLFAERAIIPAWSHVDSDFANYYLAARLYREGYPVERVYEWTWFQRQKDHIRIDQPLVGFAPSTVTSALLVLPLTWMSPLKASRFWLVINLGLLPLIAFLMRRVTSLPWRRIGVIMFLAVAPLHSNFQLGQVHLFMLLLLAIGAWCYLENRYFLSGIALAVASALKIYPVVFIVFFLLKRKWRATVGLVSGLVASILLSGGLFGVSACRIYFREILPWGLRGEIVDPYSTGWDSLNALFRRLFVFEPELNPFPVAHLPHLYAFLHAFVHALILSMFLWAIVSNDASPARRKLEWGAFCFLLLLLSSEPLPYHFVILILTATLTIDSLIQLGRPGWATVVGVLYALVCVPYTRLYRATPHGWMSLFFIPRLFWMLLLALALLYLLIMSDGASLRSRLRRPSFAYAAIAWVVLGVAGFMLELRHLAGQFDNYQTRVTTAIGSAIAVDPVVSAGDIFYGALVPKFTSSRDAYVISRSGGASIASFGGGGDWFHPAATEDGNINLAEIAAARSSRIVRFDGSGSSSSNTSMNTVAFDAEQPAISADGGTVAYIRESQGRGSLWTRSLDPATHEAQSNPESQVAGPQYDVREIAFSPEQQIIFSSWQRDTYRLYSFDPRSAVISELASNCSARYPAVSPDGEWIAFSCERGGVWQLVRMNRRTLQQRQLTTADCNSITPAWTRDSQSLIYATDCGRALGITALSTIRAVP